MLFFRKHEGQISNEGSYRYSEYIEILSLIRVIADVVNRFVSLRYNPLQGLVPRYGTLQATALKVMHIRMAEA